MTENEKNELRRQANSNAGVIIPIVTVIIAVMVFEFTTGFKSILYFAGVILIGGIAMSISVISSDNAKKKLSETETGEYVSTNLQTVFKMGEVPDTVSYYEYSTNNNSREFLYFFDYATSKFVYMNPQHIYGIPLAAINRIQVETKYRTISNTTKQNGVKRAVVGGVLAGGVGAIVGGATANSVTDSQEILENVWVKINTTELNCPILKIFCDTIDTAETIEGTILALKAKNEKTSQE